MMNEIITVKVINRGPWLTFLTGAKLPRRYRNFLFIPREPPGSVCKACLQSFDEKRARKMELLLYDDPGIRVESYQLCEDCTSQFLKGRTDQKAVLAVVHAHLFPPKGTMQ
jgi:hypothetical protein